jgi:pilus assembly protein CpaB
MATSPSAKSAKLKSPLVLLLIAALMAGAVAWVAYYYLQQREAAMKAEISAKGKRTSTPKVNVAVPLADVPAGTVLNGTNFVSRPVDEDLVYPDSILAADFPAMEGLKLARPVLHGRPIRLTDLVAPEIRDVASILPAGQRALTIEIDNVNSIAQTLRPNHHIDLFLLTKGEKRPGAAEESDTGLEQATLYMQDVVVLATGTEFHDVRKGDEGAATKMVRPGEVPGKEKDFDTVTVLVTPREAARLMVGQKMGSYRVTLRGTHDRNAVALATLRGSDLMPGAHKRRNAGIEFIVGGSEKLVSQLDVPPSQDLSRAMQQRAGFPSLPAPAPAPAPSEPERQTMTISVPATRANSPVSAFNKNQ